MGLGSKLCIVFCYLNAACLLFIAYLFDLGITAMSMAAVKRQWDRAAKARTCRYAALYYLILGLVLWVRATYVEHQEVQKARQESRRAGWRFSFPFNLEMEEVANSATERAPLLQHAGATTAPPTAPSAGDEVSRQYRGAMAARGEGSPSRPSTTTTGGGGVGVRAQGTQYGAVDAALR